MNPLNYASLPASQRLQSSGIVLETEAVWRKKRDKTGYYLSRKALYHRTSDIPAPSMAEVWRELPATLRNEDDPLVLNKALRIGDGVQVTSASYDYSTEDYGECTRKFFASTNPTDSLIDLLIWQRKEANHA